MHIRTLDISVRASFCTPMSPTHPPTHLAWKTARASGRSLALASLIDKEQGRLEDERSSLAADLVKVVADNTAKAAEAADEAGRVWWAAASAGLVSLFSAAVCLGNQPLDCGDRQALNQHRRDPQPQGCGVRRESPPRREPCLKADTDAIGGERCLGRGAAVGTATVRKQHS